jgi:uncharacterized protein (UPF0332 family)
MADPCTPGDFLNLAQELAQHYDEQIYLRTAVNRAYYAAFLTVRDRCQISVKDKRDHHKVIKYVRDRNRSAGDQLDTLFRSRTTADYVLDASQGLRYWQHEWQTVDTLVKHVLPDLENLP